MDSDLNGIDLYKKLGLPSDSFEIDRKIVFLVNTYMPCFLFFYYYGICNSILTFKKNDG